MTNEYPTPEGKLYATQQNGDEFSVARYVRTPAGNFAPQWKENVEYSEYNQAEIEGANFVSYVEVVERADGGWFNFKLYDLSGMLTVELQARKHGYETIDEYLEDAADELCSRMDRHGHSMTRRDAMDYILDAQGDIDVTEAILVEDWGSYEIFD